jgi:hypothetical protein
MRRSNVLASMLLDVCVQEAKIILGKEKRKITFLHFFSLTTTYDKKERISSSFMNDSKASKNPHHIHLLLK